MGVLSGVRWVSLDVETTGWSPDAGAVIEVACVECRGDAPVSEWRTFVNPGRPVPPESTAVHGITDADLAGAPDVAEAARALRPRCADFPLVFHNAPFDLPFLQRLFADGGQPPLLNPVLDTLGLARGLFGPGGNGLGELTAKLGLPPEGAHRALPDARATARVLIALAPKWEVERGIRTFAELAAASQDVVRLGTPRPAETTPA